MSQMNRAGANAREASNLQEWTVSGLAGALRRTLEDAFGFVRLRGEISGFRGPHASGHCYFALKDDAAKIEAVVWRTTFQRLKIKPQEGLEVVVTGRITTFPGSSKYQIVIDTIEPTGLGALMAILEERRRKLAAEGLFDEKRKRPLPFLPEVVGVITSPTGAVIRDILHRLADRFPRRVLVWGVRVQGDTSAAEVAAAIEGFNALSIGGAIPRPDVLIVARGGGSLEDLWSFNEEIVVRAAAASTIPLVAAVGHETDWTLIDHAADLRCPTPTGAAEKVVPVRAELVAQVANLARREVGAVQRLRDRRRADLRALIRVLPTRETVLALPRQRLDVAAATLAAHSPRAELRTRRAHYAGWSSRLSRDLLRRLSRDRRRAFDELAARLTQARVRRAEIERERNAGFTQRIARAGEQLRACWNAARERRANRLDALEQMLRSLSYEGVLARGFALVRDQRDRPIRTAAAVTPGMPLVIQFADGDVPAGAAGKAAKKRRGIVLPGQGSLFET
jgi:exodeoxyribonuclease VII large subunit